MDGIPDDKRPMRVLYCILDNRFGGPHRLAETMAGHLRPLGVETLFLFGQKSDDPWRPEGFESFPCRAIHDGLTGRLGRRDDLTPSQRGDRLQP